MNNIQEVWSVLYILYIEPFQNLLFQIYEQSTFEQLMSFFFCIVLLYIVRSISFIKKEIKEVREDEEAIEQFIKEIKFSESRIGDSINDLKQSHKAHFKRIGEYIPKYPDPPLDRTPEVLESITNLSQEQVTNLTGLRKRSKDQIKLLELLRREFQEVREDSASNTQQEFPESIHEIEKELYLRFNRLEKQIDNIEINPIVKVPEQKQFETNTLKQKEKDYTEQFDLLNKQIENMKTNINSFEKMKNYNSNSYFYITDKKELEFLLIEREELLHRKLKETEHKIIDIVSQSQSVVIKQSISESTEIPDFRKLNRELLLQIEEAVSSRLEELNQKILESRDISTLEIQKTIDQIQNITSVVTNKLLEVKPNISMSNNSEILQSINDLGKELQNLKFQIPKPKDESPMIYGPGISSGFESPDLAGKFAEITKIFNQGTQEIKQEVRKVGNGVEDLLIRVSHANSDVINKLDISLHKIIAKMKTLSNSINDIDITTKENQNKISMVFYNHIDNLRSELFNVDNASTSPLMDNINSRFDKIDANFDKFLGILSNIPRDGSKFEINPKILDELKQIFETDIVNQYREQMVFLELIGAKISELNTRK